MNDQRTTAKVKYGLAAALLLSTLLGLLTWRNDPFSYEPKEDSLQYHVLARNLCQHGSFSMAGKTPYEPSARRMPGYPAFLAAVYGFAGASPRTAKLIQILLGPVICGLTFVLVKQLTSRPSLGFVAAGLTAICTPIIAATNHLLTEGAFTAVLLGTLCAGYGWLHSARWTWAAATGVAWGALVLIKPEAALLPVALFPVVMWIGNKGERKILAGQFAVALLAFLALLGPWLIRNYLVLGRVKLIVSEEGVNGPGLLRSYRLGVENGVLVRPERFKYLYGDQWQKAQQRYEQAMLASVQDPTQSDMGYFLRRPGTVLKLCAIRFSGLMFPRSWSDTWGLDGDFSQYRQERAYVQLALKGLLLVVDGILIAAGLTAIVVSLLPRYRHLWLLTATALYFMAVYSLLHGIDRYRVPLLPLMIACAVVVFSRARIKSSVEIEPPRLATA